MRFRRLKHCRLTIYPRNLPSWSYNPTNTPLSSRVQDQPTLAYPTYPLSTEICALLAHLPIGFQRIGAQCTVSIQLLTIAKRVSAIQTLIAKAASQSVTAEELKDLHKYRPESEFQEGFSCLQQLRLKSFTLEYCLCLALMAFTNMAFNIMQFGSLWRRIQEDLAQAVLECTPEAYEEDCLVWAMMMAVSSWEGRLGLEEPGQRVLRTMLAHYPRTRNWAGTKEIVSEFFWTDELEKHLQRNWRPSDSADKVLWGG